jgi:hypothetical protein
MSTGRELWAIKTSLNGDTGKCLHYCFWCFDLIDEELRICYFRVLTWAPFGPQCYCNGHSALAQSRKRDGIDFVQEPIAVGIRQWAIRLQPA